MSNPHFIAIEEPLPSTRYGYKSFENTSPSRVHLLRISTIQSIECDDNKCLLDLGIMRYNVSKTDQPNTYKNLYNYCKSEDVFRASKN